MRAGERHRQDPPPAVLASRSGSFDVTGGDVLGRVGPSGKLNPNNSFACPTACWFAGRVRDIETTRLVLHAIDESEAGHICARAPGPNDKWVADYPFVGDLAAVGSLLRATELHGEQRPFGYYQIVRVADGLAVGGAGFKGPPRGGSVEVGYGLAPSARGHGYAAEALTALLILAANYGVATVLADSTADNVPSQRTLGSAGFTLVGADADLQHYEIRLGEPPPSPARASAGDRQPGRSW